MVGCCPACGHSLPGANVGLDQGSCGRVLPGLRLLIAGRQSRSRLGFMWSGAGLVRLRHCVLAFAPWAWDLSSS